MIKCCPTPHNFFSLTIPWWPSKIPGLWWFSNLSSFIVSQAIGSDVSFCPTSTFGEGRLCIQSGLHPWPSISHFFIIFLFMSGYGGHRAFQGTSLGMTGVKSTLWIMSWGTYNLTLDPWLPTRNHSLDQVVLMKSWSKVHPLCLFYLYIYTHTYTQLNILVELLVWRWL